MLNSEYTNVSKLNGTDLQRIMAHGRALQAAETRDTLRRALRLIRRIWV